MKKTYPKVPHHDHESVEQALYEADDLVLLEKVDGSNFRLCMYDERYSEWYSDQLGEFDLTDGDVFVGSKGTVRGRLSDNLNDVDGIFGRVFDTLRDTLDTNALRGLHDKYNSPLILFGEHMVKHTLDYDYNESPPPAFLGFDVFRLTEYEHPPGNPFEQRFDGFLPLDEAFDVFEHVGLDTINIIGKLDAGSNPEDITVPTSSYRDFQAEGVIIRSDSHNRRTKLVTKSFQETAKEAWGELEENTDVGAELFVARYLTNARIRKTVQKLFYRNRADDVDSATVAEAAIADAWEEELYDIRSIGTSLVPRDVYPLAQERCSEVVKTMRTNARLNETTLDRLWEDFGTASSDTDVSSFDVRRSVLSSLSERLKQADDPNCELVRAVLDANTIHSLAEDIAADVNRETGRWLISYVYDDCTDKLWYDNLGLIANLPIAITPTDVNDALLEYITEEIEARDDVVIDEKSEDWEISIEDADTSGLSSLF